MAANQPAVATATKTKLKMHQTALVGIAAVCTATLLAAFTANFAILVMNLVSIATTPSCTNPANVACGKPVTAVQRQPSDYTYKQFTTDRGYVPGNLTDTNPATFAYASDFRYGYEIDLQGAYNVQHVDVTWGKWGFSFYEPEQNKSYMKDYHVYGLKPTGQWVEIQPHVAGAPNATTTILYATTTPTTLPIYNKIRVTSGWGLQPDGASWDKFGPETAGGNWLGLYDVQVIGTKMDVVPMGVSPQTNNPSLGMIDVVSGYYSIGGASVTLLGSSQNSILKDTYYGTHISSGGGSGPYKGPTDYLTVLLFTGRKINLPQTEFSININNRIKTIYLPSVSFTTGQAASIAFYVAADGSTYYGNTSHTPTQSISDFFNLDLFGALQPAQIARRAPSSIGTGVGRGGGVPTHPAPMGVPPQAGNLYAGTIDAGSGRYNDSKVRLRLSNDSMLSSYFTYSGSGNNYYGEYGAIPPGGGSNFSGTSDYLTVFLYTQGQLNQPQTEFTISIGNGIKAIYLPSISFTQWSTGITFYIAADGSTYYASSTHQPSTGDTQVNLGLFEALQPTHLARQAPLNLLPNTSFEQNSITTDYQTYSVNGATIKQSTKAHAGNYSAEVDTKAGGLYKKFTIGTGLKPGTTYRLSAYLLHELGENYGRLSVCAQYFKDSANSWQIECTSNVATGTADQWNLSQLQFKTTTNASARQDVILYVGFADQWVAGVGRYFIDDAALNQVQ